MLIENTFKLTRKKYLLYYGKNSLEDVILKFQEIRDYSWRLTSNWRENRAINEIYRDTIV